MAACARARGRAALKKPMPYLKNAVVDGEDGDIKGAAPQVEHQDVLLLALLVQAVGKGCCCGLIDDALHLQPRNGSCSAWNKLHK